LVCITVTTVGRSPESARKEPRSSCYRPKSPPCGRLYGFMGRNSGRNERCLVEGWPTAPWPARERPYFSSLLGPIADPKHP
jgi:hypothetical protein